jgi:hypothetical protein
VHREQLVVALRIDEVIVWFGELEPHGQRKQAAEDEENQRRDDVTAADLLMIDGRQPADQAGRAAPRSFKPRREPRATEVGPIARDGHLSVSR